MIEEEKLKILLDSIISRAKDGENPEEEKLELKREWYKFNQKNPETKKIVESEFIKDITAIANTPGPQGHLIIGIDENNGDVYDSPFKNSGLKDVSDLYYLVVKSVDLPFKFELKEIEYLDNGTKKNISVINIPPSIDKPHVIRLYKSGKQEIQHFIPVRKGTNICPASRSDIEFMYYDRKNIEPDYALDFLLYNSQWSIRNADHNKISLSFFISFQNSGRKPIAIVSLTLKIYPNNTTTYPSELLCDLSFYTQNIGDNLNTYIKDNPIIIPSNQIIFCDCKFYYDSYSPELLKKLKEMKDYEYQISAGDIVGNSYNSKLFQKISKELKVDLKTNTNVDREIKAKDS